MNEIEEMILFCQKYQLGNLNQDLDKIFILFFAYYLFLWRENFSLKNILEIMRLRFLVSGFVFFYLTLYLYFNYTKELIDYKKIKIIFLIQALYLLVDYYLDYNNGEIEILYSLTEIKDVKDPYLFEIKKSYDYLISKHPEIKEFILLSLNKEVSAFKKEKRNQDISILKSESKEKSYHFFLFLEKILSLDCRIKYLAFVIQLLDDILDIEEDKELNIYTYIQEKYEREKKLDNVLFEAYKIFTSMELKDKILECFISNFIIYTVKRRKEYFSKELIESFSLKKDIFNQDIENIIFEKINREKI